MTGDQSLTPICENNPQNIVPKHRSKAVPRTPFGTALERHFGTFQNTVPLWNDIGTIGPNYLNRKDKKRNASGTINENRQTPFHTPRFFRNGGEGWNTGTIATERRT